MFNSLDRPEDKTAANARKIEPSHRGSSVRAADREA